MRLEIKLIGDNEELLVEQTLPMSSIMTPTQWRPNAGQYIRYGHYELFGLTVQPHGRSTHPSGYQAEPPKFSTSPNPPSGVPQTTAPLPNPFTGLGRTADDRSKNPNILRGN
jgi:hypothetical protein